MLVRGLARPAVISLAVFLAASLSVVMYYVALAEVGLSDRVPTESAESSFEFISLGHLGGPANAVETDGAFAYVGFANELAVLEVVGSLQRVGYVLVDTKIEDILVAAGYAYIAAGESGLWIVDIQVPEFPDLVGHVDTPGYAHGLAKEANVLYLADGVGGLRTISVIDPTTPVEIGSVPLPGHGLGIASSGRYAYVAIAEMGLQVVDVVNPGQPVLLGIHDTSGNALGIVVQDQTAYIADGDGGLQLVDITDPGLPKSISGLGVGGAAKDLSLDAGLAYIAADEAGLVIVDVSSPLSLTQKGTISTTSRTLSAAKFDQSILLANWSEGLQQIDVTDPEHPLWVDSYEPPANARGGIEAAGRTVYVGDDMGIKIVDVTAPSLPAQMGNERLPGGSTNLVLDSDLLYVTGGYSGLHIVDVSESQAPETIGGLDTPGYASDVALRDAYAFVADFNSGVRSVDISTPTNPIGLSSLSVFGSVVAVDLVSNTLFAAASGGGLRIIDTEDPLNLVEIGHYSTTNNVRDVDVVDDIAYLAEGGLGLTILDVANPSDISVIARLPETDYAFSVIVDGPFAYVSDNRGRVHTVDVAVPSQPAIVASYGTPAAGVGVAAALGSGDAYLASDSWGLFVTTGDLAIQGRIVDHNDQPIHSVQVEGSFGRSSTSVSDGSFEVGSYLPGSYTVTPTLIDRAFVPTAQTVILPQSGQPAQFIAVAAPITATVGPTQEVEIGYYDVQGLPTSFYIPSGAFSTTTLIEVTPTIASDTPEALFAGHGFIFETRTGTTTMAQFGEPISITISYSDLDIFGVSNEAELWLRWRDGELYSDAAESCSPSAQYQRVLAANTISIAVCQSGEYILMGPISRIYLPLLKSEAD